MGCHFILQEIFPTQGSSPHLLCLLHWQTGSLPPAPRKPHVSFCYTAKGLSYTYTCIHSFLDSFPIKVTAEYWVEFPVPSRGSLLVICCRCSRVCLSGSVFGQHLPGPVQVGAALLSWGGRTFSAWPPGGTVTAASQCLVRVGPARNHGKVLLTAGPQGNPREFHLNAQPVSHCSQREISRVGSCTPPQVHVANRRTASPRPLLFLLLCHQHMCEHLDAPPHSR